MEPNNLQPLRLSKRPAFARLIGSSEEKKVLVSTYQLDSDGVQRSGSLCIIGVHPDGLSLDHEIATNAGVFRFEFVNPSTAISALTDGSISINHLTGDFRYSTIPVSSHMLLDVSTKNSSLVSVTDNKGFVYIVDTNTETLVSSWLAHSLQFTTEGCEVWTCSINDDASLVATGGEDGAMKVWDVRTRTSVAHCSQFGAGVTFVEWQDDNVLKTGSYDESIRIVDRRKPKSSLHEVKLGGGVWNIEKTAKGNFVAACMYNGYAVLDADWTVLHQNAKAGEQLLYGATSVGPTHVVYCTFNDYSIFLEAYS